MRRKGWLKWVAMTVVFSFLCLSLGDFHLQSSDRSGRGADSLTSATSDENGVIEQPAPRPPEVKKRGFPWLVVAAAVVLIGAVGAYFLLLRKVKYTLTVALGQYVYGGPSAGSFTYKKGEVVSYQYSAVPGFGGLQVKLDGADASSSGNITMDRDHAIQAEAATQLGFKKVVVEAFTSTNHADAPGVAMGLDQLKQNYPSQAIVIAYHTDDPFSNPDLFNARKASCNVTTIPDVLFLGKDHVSGGSPTTSQYPRYQSMYKKCNQFYAELKYRLFSMGGNVYNVDVTNYGPLPLEGTFFMALTEDNIAYQWQSQSVVRFVCRAMYPTVNGDPISVGVNQKVTKSCTLSINSGWVYDNLHLVIFVRSNTGEIMEGLEAVLPPR